MNYLWAFTAFIYLFFFWVIPIGRLYQHPYLKAHLFRVLYAHLLIGGLVCIAWAVSKIY